MKPLTLNASQKMKKTPVGDIPVEWEVRSLENVVDPSRPISYGIVQTGGYVPGGVRCVRVIDLTASQLNTAEMITTTPEISAQYKRTVLQKGDIMFPLRGEIGKVAIVGENLVGANLTRGIALISKSASVRSEYLYWALQSPQTYEKIRESTNGSALIEIPIGALRRIPVAIPPLDEQIGIADILNLWNQALAKTESLLSAKRQCKAGVMQQLLTGKRRSNGWKAYHLGELFDERVEIGRGDLPLLSITGDRGIVNRDDLDKKDISNADKGKYLRIAPGDIGYNTMRMWQGVSALSELEGIISPAYTVCIPKTGKIDGRFAAHLFKHPPIVRRFWRYSQGMVDDTLNLKFHNFAQVRVEIPPLEQQRKIVAVLSGCDRELGLLERKLDALREQKKGLMQMLLTGKIRVKGRQPCIP